MKRKNRTHLAISLVLFMMTVGTASAESDSTLTWKMAFLRWNKTDYEAQPFVRPIKLSNGDEFQLYVQAERPAFLYIVEEGPEGIVKLLTRLSLRANTPLFLPAQDDSYTIAVPSGTEKIFLVISPGRQANLENCLDLLTEQKGDRLKTSQAVLDEVASIRQGASRVAEAPERPVPMGGVTRGSKQIQATEFHGQSTYVKTIRLDH